MEYVDKLSDEEAEENLRAARQKIFDETAGAGDCEILLATKTVSPGQINRVTLATGNCLIGENRVQELCDKYPYLDRERLRIHFIGHLQTNKVKQIIDKVEMIHSLDRESLALEINRRAEEAGLVMDVLCEINIGREAEKSGVLPEKAEELCEMLAGLPHLRLRGVMTMAPKLESEAEYELYFRETRQIYERIRAKDLPNTQIDTLSMGMSESYTVAARCGATVVRLGGAVFGRRIYPT